MLRFHQAAQEKGENFTMSYRVTEGDVSEPGDTRVFYGAVRGSPATQDFVKQLFDQSADVESERPISRERFAELTRRLEAAGLFSLPRFNGEEPPPDASFFLLEEDGVRRIFVKPPASSAPSDSPAGKQRDSWKKSVQMILDTL